MDKAVKQKLRRLWRDRLVVSIGALAVLGFSVLQLQSVLKHRHYQPSWSLELAQSIEVLTDENSSAEKIERALSEIQDIAQERQLLLTELLVKPQDRALTLALAWALIQEQDWAQVQSPTLAPALVRALVKSQDHFQSLVGSMAPVQPQAWLEDRALVLLQKHEQFLVQPMIQAQDRLRALNPLLLATHGLALDLAQVRAQAQALGLDLAQVRAQAQALDMSQNSSFFAVVTVELVKTHGLTLQQGRALEQLLSSEPNRTRVLLQSGVLLGISSLVLVTLLFALTRLQGSYSFPPTTHLIAFLPEECVAELGSLQRRMKKAKASPLQICLRLLEEFVTLLWVFYIQVRLENLGLPSSDRQIDD